MAKFVDTWLAVNLSGTSTQDAVKYLQVTVTDDSGIPWGISPVGGMGFTPWIDVRQAGATVIFAAVAGVWADANQSRATFPISATFLPGAGITTQIYEFTIRVTAGTQNAYAASDQYGTPWSFEVKRWPEAP